VRTRGGAIKQCGSTSSQSLQALYGMRLPMDSKNCPLFLKSLKGVATLHRHRPSNWRKNAQDVCCCDLQLLRHPLIRCLDQCYRICVRKAISAISCRMFLLNRAWGLNLNIVSASWNVLPIRSTLFTFTISRRRLPVAGGIH
jgi:hypothetical protein